MKYYVYRIDDPITKEFYIGSRSCKCEILEDNYMGSYKTWKPEDKTRLVKTILKSNFRKIETCIIYEAKLIKKNINDELNRNYHIPNEGFHTTGVKYSDDVRQKNSKFRIENKIAKGKNNGMYGKSQTAETILLMKSKAIGRYTLSWFIDKYGKILGNEKYNIKANTQRINSRGSKNGMYQKSHTNETKSKMSESSKKRVGKYDTEKNLLYIYNSINEASLANNISISSISAVCNPNRINKTAGGFVYKLM